MTLEEYVKTILKRPNITKVQAKFLGIKYPLVKGWFDLNKDKVIEDPEYFFSLSTEGRKRGKNNMSQDVWDSIKQSIQEYFV